MNSRKPTHTHSHLKTRTFPPSSRYAPSFFHGVDWRKVAANVLATDEMRHIIGKEILNPPPAFFLQSPPRPPLQPPCTPQRALILDWNGKLGVPPVTYSTPPPRFSAFFFSFPALCFPFFAPLPPLLVLIPVKMIIFLICATKEAFNRFFFLFRRWYCAPEGAEYTNFFFSKCTHTLCLFLGIRS